jgi:hypothetical protein
MTATHTSACHETSLAVWDVASPVVIGCQATLKVGITCPSGCDLTGTRIEICDENGAPVGGGEVGPVPWPDTVALYWAEIDVAVSETEGEHSWSLRAAAPDPSHRPAASVVRVLASRPPEHRVTIEAIDSKSGVAMAGVDLRLGTFRAATDAAGVAHIELPGGTYEVCAWKIGYDLLTATALISNDTTLRLELTLTPEREEPYWM